MFFVELALGEPMSYRYTAKIPIILNFVVFMPLTSLTALKILLIICDRKLETFIWSMPIT